MTALSAKNLDLTDPVLQEAVDLLIAHQRAVCAGNEDEADKLLANLERPLRRLTWEQNEWLRGLSGDLQMLSGEEVREPNSLSESEFLTVLPHIWANVETDPSGLLNFLRKDQKSLPDDLVAMGRARAYAELGFRNLFWAFADYAVHLAPDNSSYNLYTLFELYKENRFNEILELGIPLLEGDKASSIVKLFAAQQLFVASADLKEYEKRTLLGKIRRVVEVILNGGEQKGLNAEWRANGMMLLADISDKLRRASDRRMWLKRAIEINPQNDLPYIGMGIALYDDDRERASTFFAEAVKMGTELALPYLCLAQAALVKEDYKQCRQLSYKVLQLSDDQKLNDQQLAATAYELIGLADLYEGGPTEKAIASLQIALELFPDGQNFHSNLEAAREMLPGEVKAEMTNLVNLKKIDTNLISSHLLQNEACSNRPRNCLAQISLSETKHGESLAYAI